MKKTIVIIDILIFLISLKLIYSFCVNEIVISRYNQDNYDVKGAKKLLTFNIFEPCIARYNYGNVLYMNNDYDSAVEEYKKALDLFPTKKQECSIRINLALAMLKKIDIENQEKKEILEILDNAENVLCENGCANLNDNNGHSKEAEELKSDIEKFKKQLDEEQEKDEKKDEDEPKEKEDKKNSEIEEKLKAIQKESTMTRNDKLEQVKMLEKFEFYHGKKW